MRKVPESPAIGGGGFRSTPKTKIKVFLIEGTAVKRKGKGWKVSREGNQFVGECQVNKRTRGRKKRLMYWGVKNPCM